MSNHVHSFDPRGRGQCSCGQFASSSEFIQKSIEACSVALQLLTNAERKEVVIALRGEGLLGEDER